MSTLASQDPAEWFIRPEAHVAGADLPLSRYDAAYRVPVYATQRSGHCYTVNTGCVLKRNVRATFIY